jgi:hypothetical protein
MMMMMMMMMILKDEQRLRVCETGALRKTFISDIEEVI